MPPQVTTVGYGDKVPRTPFGRLVGLVWLVFGLAMFSVLNGHMANRFVEIGLEGEVHQMQDLRDWRICGYPTTFQQPWLGGVRTINFERASVAECGELLRTGKVDGVLMDTPIMAYYRNQASWARDATVQISKPLVNPLIGLAYPEDESPVRELINAELLQVLGTADYKALYDSWFPTDDQQYLEATFQLEMIVPAIVLLGCYIVLQVTIWVYRRREQAAAAAMTAAEVAATAGAAAVDVAVDAGATAVDAAAAAQQRLARTATGLGGSAAGAAATVQQKLARTTTFGNISSRSPPAQHVQRGHAMVSITGTGTGASDDPV